MHLSSGAAIIAGLSWGDVLSSGDAGFNSSVGAVRQYYVAAEKVLWDFAPLGGNACSGGMTPLNAYGAAHVVHNASRGHIGSKRWRAHYIEYTDATFTQRKVLQSVALPVTRECRVYVVCKTSRAQSQLRETLMQWLYAEELWYG